MRPSVGRIVHYVNLGDRTVTKPYDAGEREYVDLELVNDGVGTPTDEIADVVDLKVFYKTGLFDCQKIPMRTEPTNRGVWDWSLK